MTYILKYNMMPKTNESALSLQYCCVDCRGEVHLYFHFGKPFGMSKVILKM